MHISNKAMDFTKTLVLLSSRHYGNEDVKKGIWYLKKQKDKQTFFADIYSKMVLLKVTTDASFSFLYLGMGQ